MKTSTLFQLAAGFCIRAFVSGVQANVIVKAPNPNIPGVTQVISASFPGVSAIGVQADGAATTYVGTEVDSFAGLATNGATSTILNTVATAVVTFVEGASTYSVSVPVTATIDGQVGTGGKELVCTGDVNAGDVSCVEAESVSLGTFVTAATTSFSASMLPVFTITATGSGTGPGSGPGPGTGPGTGAGTGTQGQAQPSPTKNQGNGIRAVISSLVISVVAGFLFGAGLI